MRVHIQSALIILFQIRAGFEFFKMVFHSKRRCDLRRVDILLVDGPGSHVCRRGKMPQNRKRVAVAPTAVSANIQNVGRRFLTRFVNPRGKFLRQGRVSKGRDLCHIDRIRDDIAPERVMGGHIALQLHAEIIRQLFSFPGVLRIGQRDVERRSVRGQAGDGQLLCRLAQEHFLSELFLPPSVREAAQIAAIFLL